MDCRNEKLKNFCWTFLSYFLHFSFADSDSTNCCIMQ